MRAREPHILATAAACLIVALVALPSPATAAPLVASPHTAVCFRDTDGITGASPGDAWLLQVAACGNSGGAPGDLRVTGVPNRYLGGTVVYGGDDDAGRTTQAVAAAGYAWIDLDGTGTYSAADAVVLHIGSLPATASGSDIALTGRDAFSPVANTTWLNQALHAGPNIGDEMYIDADGDGAYSQQDRLYLDMDTNGNVGASDVRMFRTASVSPPPPTPPVTPTPTLTPNPTPPPRNAPCCRPAPAHPDPVAQRPIPQLL